MNDTSSPMSPLPLAFYDPDSCSWKMWLGTSLWGDQKSLERLPDWGMTRGGELYERPTPGLLTAARDCSSSQLPTPHANAATGAGRQGRDGGANLQTAVSLLPTPTARDWKDGTPSNVPTNGLLGREVWALLPTPTVNDMGAGKTPEQWDQWAARQKAADGRPAPHGKSLEQEAIRLLPTPRAQNGEPRNDTVWARPLDQPQNLDENALARIQPPSPDGNTSSDDQPLLPLSLEPTDDPD